MNSPKYFVVLFASLLIPSSAFAGSEILRRNNEPAQVLTQELPTPKLSGMSIENETLDVKNELGFQDQLSTKSDLFQTSKVTWDSPDESGETIEAFEKSPYVEWDETYSVDSEMYENFLAKGRYSRTRSLAYSSYQGVGRGSSYGSRPSRRVYYTPRGKSSRRNSGFATINNNGFSRGRISRNYSSRGVSGNFDSSSFATLGRQRR